MARPKTNDSGQRMGKRREGKVQRIQRGGNDRIQGELVGHRSSRIAQGVPREKAGRMDLVNYLAIASEISLTAHEGARVQMKCSHKTSCNR